MPYTDDDVRSWSFNLDLPAPDFVDKQITMQIERNLRSNCSEARMSERSEGISPSPGLGLPHGKTGALNAKSFSIKKVIYRL